MSAIALTVRFTWWAWPAAYAVARLTLPFVGDKRALFYAGKVACLGLRVDAK